MCCKIANEVAQSDLALNQAQTAMTQQLNQDYAVNFAQYEQVMQQQKARLNAIASNPMGLPTQELAAATTNINEGTAKAAQQALGKAAAFAAAHGGADTGAGPTGMIAGEIASEAAQSKAAQLSQLSAENSAVKQQNFWKATQSLQDVGNSFGGAAGGDVSGSSGLTEAATNAGTGAVNASNIVAEDVGGILGGIGGLASAGVGAYKAFKG